MTGRCKNCRFHDESVGYDDYGWPGSGECIRWLRGYHVAADTMFPNSVLIEDDEGWGNVTGPEFGCVLFEKKAKAA